MPEHHIQQTILERLTGADSLRFSELKPADLENKAFDYHLKALLREKFIEKNEAGGYSLTALGKKHHSKLSIAARSERAFSVLYLAVYDDSKGWLLYTRKTHPLKDGIGFMHAIPESHLTIAESASNTLREKTGLDATFTVRANGYFRMFAINGELESFTHFTLLFASNPSGILAPNDSSAIYDWYQNMNQPNLLPNMPDLVKLLEDENCTFFEATYRL